MSNSICTIKGLYPKWRVEAIILLLELRANKLREYNKKSCFLPAFLNTKINIDQYNNHWESFTHTRDNYKYSRSNSNYTSWKSLLIWSTVAGTIVTGQRLYCNEQKYAHSTLRIRWEKAGVEGTSIDYVPFVTIYPIFYR